MTITSISPSTTSPAASLLQARTATGFLDRLQALVASADPASLSGALRAEQTPAAEDALSLSGARSPQAEDLLAFRPGGDPLRRTSVQAATPASPEALLAPTVGAVPLASSEASTTVPAVPEVNATPAAAESGRALDAVQSALAGGSLVAAQVMRYGSAENALGRNLDIVLAVSPASPVSGFEGASRQATSQDGRPAWREALDTSGLRDYA